MTKKEREAIEKKNNEGGLKPGDEGYIDPATGETTPAGGSNNGMGDQGNTGANTGNTNAGGDQGGNKPPKSTKKTIEVDEGLLKQLIASNKEMAGKLDKLESNAAVTGPQGLQVRRKVKDFDYNVRIWEDQVVMGFENVGKPNRPLFVYTIFNDQSRQNEQFVNLVLEDGKIVKKIDYMAFLRDAEKVKARLISKVEHEDVKEYGMIPKKEMAENGYGMFETMVLVPVEVVTKTYTFKLKLPEKEWEGREIDIESEWVNI